MATLTANQARQKAVSSKLNPQDYGISSWSNADYQTLANALNVNIGGANNINKILAYPGGSTDPVTKQILNEQQTQQAAASYNKDNAIATANHQTMQSLSHLNASLQDILTRLDNVERELHYGASRNMCDMVLYVLVGMLIAFILYSLLRK